MQYDRDDLANADHCLALWWQVATVEQQRAFLARLPRRTLVQTVATLLTPDGHIDADRVDDLAARWAMATPLERSRALHLAGLDTAREALGLATADRPRPTPGAN